MNAACSLVVMNVVGILRMVSIACSLSAVCNLRGIFITAVKGTENNA